MTAPLENMEAEDIRKFLNAHVKSAIQSFLQYGFEPELISETFRSEADLLDRRIEGAE